MQLIIINGASCSGKTSVVKKLSSTYPKLFHLSYDRLKWMISDYQAARDYAAIRKIILVVASTVFSLEYDVICDFGLQKTVREAIIQKAKEHDYAILEVNLEADYKILYERFMERVEKKKQDPSARIANASVKRFDELNDMYNNDKNPAAKTFDSGELSIEEIVDEISSLLSP